MKPSSLKQLESLHARDLMQGDVVTLSDSAPVEEAVRTFDEYHISGAPVVDSAGRLVGVLSAADVSRTEHVQEGRIASEGRRYYLANPIDEAWDEGLEFDQEDYNPEVLGHRTVREWMNPGVISVSPDATLKEVCSVMADRNIHRVLVVEGEVLRGIVSSFDVVRTLAGHL